MFFRKEHGWELYGSIHPASVGCAKEGRDICTCKYHVVNDGRTIIHSFDDFQEAEDKFRELSFAGDFRDQFITQTFDGR